MTRCIHRHTIKEHPSCFKKGLIKEYKPIINKEEHKHKVELSSKPWYKEDGLRVGYFDIETDNLNADFGTMLSWVIKEKDGAYHYDVITKDDLFSGVYDKRIVESFLKELKRYDIIMGYYSTGFDLPFVRAKALHYELPFPGYGDIYHWDLYYTVRNKLKISRKSLDNACDFLNIPGKTQIDKSCWRKGKYGDEESLAYILDHNLADCKILEELHNKLEFTRKWIKTSL